MTTIRKTSTLRMAVIYTLIFGAAICVFFLYCFALPSLYVRFPVPVETIRSHAQELYWRGIRDIIQLNPRCARYDPDLGYLLRPGNCRFENLEFDTAIHVNSKGLRDDENSLVRPELVAIGDSYTMGWGVEAEESFPELIERRLNKKR